MGSRPRTRKAAEKAAQVAAVLADTRPAEATKLFHRTAVATYSSMRRTGLTYQVPLAVLTCCELMGRFAAGQLIEDGRARSRDMGLLTAYFADGVYRTWMGMAEGFDHAHFQTWRESGGDSGAGSAAHGGAEQREQDEVRAG